MLAKIQAKIIGKSLVNKNPSLSIEYHVKTALADRNSNLSLLTSNSIGLFTKDISKQIITGQCDIAIHSWKDLPVELSKETKIIATVDRGDMRDVLIVKKETAKCRSKANIQILSSSPRRQHNLKKILPNIVPFKYNDISFHEVRGNIETRLKKFVQGDADGIVMAKVAIDRILESDDNKAKKFINSVLNDNKWLILPLSVFPTAPGQGAIAIEARKDRSDVKQLLKTINNKDVYRKVDHEKLILSQYGGGCQQKIGISIWSERGHDIYSMTGLTENGKEIKEFDFFNKIEDDSAYKFSEKSVYPDNKGNQIFKRNKVDANDELKLLKKSFVYLSRKNVIDDISTISDSNYFWTSGMKCWEHASKMGYWINGTSDSMGDKHLEDLENFIPKNIARFKLSHSKAYEENYKLIPTYDLKVIVESIKNLEIDNKRHFFWMSSYQFDTILKYFPEIISADHSSGFGKTFDHLKHKLPNSSNVKCFLSFEHWLSYHKKESENE